MIKQGLRGDSGGYAGCYLVHCQRSKSEDEIDIQVYNKLVEVDSKFGISAAEQLFYCIFITLRLDVIKV